MPRDLISIDSLTLDGINQIHTSAQNFFRNPGHQDSSLNKKLLINFFFENSTRTRTSFEIAARRMNMDVVNIDISLSSLKKGESIIDTAKTIAAMQPDFVAIRHNASGILDILKKYIPCSLINAGDGTNEHPSQALLDSFVIRQHKDLKNITIAICGDVLHSRVAHSNIKLLKKFGAKIRVITPPTLITKDYKNFLKNKFDIEIFENLEAGISGVDVVMMLRIQQERMLGCYVPSLNEYFKLFGLTHQKLQLAKPDVLVLHPGPINREVEISSALADDEKFSLILEQVEAGVSIRRALLKFLA